MGGTSAIVALALVAAAAAFGTGGAPGRARPHRTPSALRAADNLLVLDHVNINHEAGRHDLVKAFYYDAMRLSVDPRKAENIATGRNTLWANCGATQFHIPEDAAAQVLSGPITLHYADTASLEALAERLAASAFACERDAAAGTVTTACPWGNVFVAKVGPGDPRGFQPGPVAAEQDGPVGIAAVELCVRDQAALDGTRRFFETVLDARTSVGDDGAVAIHCGPHQDLRFRVGPVGPDAYDDGYGPHISMCVTARLLLLLLVVLLRPRAAAAFTASTFTTTTTPLLLRLRLLRTHSPRLSLRYVKDLSATWDRAVALGAETIFASPRFKRKAYTKPQALEQCMFRTLSIVDPAEDVAPGAARTRVARLELEVRASTNEDGTKYRSYPFEL